MSALSLLQALIREIEALPVVADHPTTFQPAAGSGDAAWGPSVPPGHSPFSWGAAPAPSFGAAPHASKLFTLRNPQEMAARAQQAAQAESKKDSASDALISKPEEKKGKPQQPQQQKQQQQQQQKPQDDKQKGKGQQQQGGKGQQQQGGKGQQQQQQQQQQQGKGKGQQQQQQGGGKPAAADPRSAFYEIDIRVGKITKAWDHPKADKLYVELIDIGEPEPRQVLSGLKQAIPIDQFVGSECLVIVNLKPAVMMDITSYGMVLAAKKDNKIELVKPPKSAPVGARVFLQGEEDIEWPEAAEQVDARKKGSSWQVVGPLLKTNAEGLVCLGDKPLAVADGPLRSTITNGTVS